jgi:type II secretory pathway component PulF
MPEGEAVRLAADGVDNAVVVRKAERMVADLKSGRGLAEALTRLDDRLELAWRVRNAAAGVAGFRVALAGWLASLDARAFRQEQSAAHVLTTAVVLFNGVLVGFLVVGTFQVLVRIVNEGVLW